MAARSTLRIGCLAVVAGALGASVIHTLLSPTAVAAEPGAAGSTYKVVSLPADPSDEVVEQKLNEMAAQGWEVRLIEKFNHGPQHPTVIFQKKP